MSLSFDVVFDLKGMEAENEKSGLPCLVFVHGESFEWSSGNSYDGTTLAAHGNIIVVTINFRLGVLGKSIDETK